MCLVYIYCFYYPDYLYILPNPCQGFNTESILLRIITVTVYVAICNEAAHNASSFILWEPQFFDFIVKTDTDYYHGDKLGNFKQKIIN